MRMWLHLYFRHFTLTQRSMFICQPFQTELVGLMSPLTGVVFLLETLSLMHICNFQFLSFEGFCLVLFSGHAMQHGGS